MLPDAAPRKCRLQHSNLHDDYITCLAAARHNYMVVTAGLRGELGFWDVHKGLEVSRHPQVRIRAMSSHALITSQWPVLARALVKRAESAPSVACGRC